MKLCCEQMVRGLKRVDQRGSHIVPMESSLSTYWGILYRNYDYDNAIKRPEEYKVLSFEESGGIKFCPYCGYKLEKLWKKYPEVLRKVIQEYKVYNKLIEE